MSEWQPIETAPKDGSPILIWQPGGVTQYTWYTDCWICRWEDRYQCWTEAGGELYSEARSPTHWMPLPDPPKP